MAEKGGVAEQQLSNPVGGMADAQRITHTTCEYRVGIEKRYESSYKYTGSKYMAHKSITISIL